MPENYLASGSRVSGGSSHHKKNVWKTLWKKKITSATSPLCSSATFFFLHLCVLWFHFSFALIISRYWLGIYSSPNLALCKQFITASLLCLTLRYRNLLHLNFLTQQLWTTAGLLVSHLNLQVRPPEVEPPASFFCLIAGSSADSQSFFREQKFVLINMYWSLLYLPYRSGLQRDVNLSHLPLQACGQFAEVV